MSELFNGHNLCAVISVRTPCSAPYVRLIGISGCVTYFSESYLEARFRLLVFLWPVFRKIHPDSISSNGLSKPDRLTLKTAVSILF